MCLNNPARLSSITNKIRNTIKIMPINVKAIVCQNKIVALPKVKGDCNILIICSLLSAIIILLNFVE